MDCKNCSNYGTCNIDDMYGYKTTDNMNGWQDENENKSTPAKKAE